MTMDNGIVVPRITPEQLDHYIGRTVRLVGKVAHNPHTNVFMLETGDHNKVQIKLQTVQETGKFVELVGVVNQDLSVVENSVVNFGDDFDMDNYLRLLRIMQEYPDTF